MHVGVPEDVREIEALVASGVISQEGPPPDDSWILLPVVLLYRKGW